MKYVTTYLAAVVFSVSVATGQTPSVSSPALAEPSRPERAIATPTEVTLPPVAPARVDGTPFGGSDRDLRTSGPEVVRRTPAAPVATAAATGTPRGAATVQPTRTPTPVVNTPRGLDRQNMAAPKSMEKPESFSKPQSMGKPASLNVTPSFTTRTPTPGSQVK